MPIELWWWVEPTFLTGILTVFVLIPVAAVIEKIADSPLPYIIAAFAFMPWIIDFFSVLVWLLANILIIIWR